MKWIVVLLFAPLVSFAGYGDAGCGLGSVIITKNSKVLQLFVITTNYATGGLTFSMTTGTSNCKVNGIVKKGKELQYYTEVNHEQIIDEIARGKGEHLATIATLFGCESHSLKAFSADMQANYSSVVSSPNMTSNQLLVNMNSQMFASGVCQ